MQWTVLNFGKHRGKTLPQVMFNDPDWFFHMVEKNVFAGKGSLEREAEDIDRKSRHIKIPDGLGEDMVVEYITQVPTGKFAQFNIVPASRARVGSSPLLCKEYIDMSVPFSIAGYDKTGYQLFLLNFKQYFFGDVKTRFTKKKAEDFFSKSQNFAING